MTVFSELASNPLVNIGFLSWAAAQIIKTILNYFAAGKLNLERLVGSGGMPSSHSALVTSLCMGVARVEGYESPLFAMSLALAGIVMYDAMGVRRAAGEHAKLINRMIFDFSDLFAELGRMAFDNKPRPKEEVELSEEVTQEGVLAEEKEGKLKEYIGHTPLEVLAGALLGILIALLYNI